MRGRYAWVMRGSLRGVVTGPPTLADASYGAIFDLGPWMMIKNDRSEESSGEGVGEEHSAGSWDNSFPFESCVTFVDDVLGDVAPLFYDFRGQVT